MSTIEKLQENFDRARIALINAQDAERDRVSRPELRKCVGKCFKFHNSYGGEEKWWLYIRIVSFDEKKMTFLTVQFQHKSDNNIEIEHRREYNFEGRFRFGYDSSWIPIEQTEYERERNNLLKLVEKLLAGELAGTDV